jgi:two-component system C4-dicarboxylate transport sensor histidine kinase DctB
VLRAELAEGVRFRGRPGEPARIVLALVENAVQCLRAGGRAGGSVRVLAEARAGLAVIEVRDTGGGIAPQAAARLFTPGASSTGGTGVGLVIARGLAERGGGSLSWSPLDGGSCFRLCFPLAREGPVVA